MCVPTTSHVPFICCVESGFRAGGPDDGCGENEMVAFLLEGQKGYSWVFVLFSKPILTHAVS